MLNDILILNQQWLPNQSDFPPISWPLYRDWPSPIMSGSHGAFATGVACQQGTLTLPDTWFRSPLWDLLVLQLLRPDSSNLPCLYSTFHLEYPLVLSRFCFTWYFHIPVWVLPHKKDADRSTKCIVDYRYHREKKKFFSGVALVLQCGAKAHRSPFCYSALLTQRTGPSTIRQELVTNVNLLWPQRHLLIIEKYR